MQNFNLLNEHGKLTSFDGLIIPGTLEEQVCALMLATVCISIVNVNILSMIVVEKRAFYMPVTATAAENIMK